MTRVGKPPAHLRTRRQLRIANISTVISMLILASIVAFGWFHPSIVTRAWLIPLRGGMFLTAMVTLPEHYLCQLGPGTALETTRTTVSNRLVRFFFWGTNFHTAHHLVGGIPSHRLAKVPAMMADQYGHMERGYLRWHTRRMWMLASGRHPTAT
jgi:fatty acid desaturase